MDLTYRTPEMHGTKSRFLENRGMLGPTVRMKDFVESSKKLQTLYANCEGFYSRRIISLESSDQLREFISCTLFFDGSFPNLSEEQNCKVAQIQRAMISLSKRFNTFGEVHYSVVWVHYYDYDSEKKGTTPLFKVYKSKNDSQKASFVDVNLNVYDGWDDYLDNERLPKSLICIPRNGGYVFEAERGLLDLIYVFSNSFRSLHQKCSTSQAMAVHKPFCQVILRPLFNGLKEVIRTSVEKIKATAIFFLSWLEKNRNALPAIISSVYICLESFFPSVKLYTSKIFATNLMFFNLDPGVSKAFSPEIPKALHKTTSLVELKNYLKALKNNLENSCPLFLTVVDFLLITIEFFFTNEEAISVIFTLLQIVFHGVTLFFGCWSDKEKYKSVAHDADLLPAKKPSSSVWLDRVAKVETVEALISNLDQLEKVSWEKIAEDARKKSVSSPGKRIAHDSKVFQIPIDDLSFPGSLFYSSEATLSEIREGLRPILKDFTYKTRNHQTYELLGDKGEVLATLFHVEDSLALVYVPEVTPQKDFSPKCLAAQENQPVALGFQCAIAQKET